MERISDERIEALASAGVVKGTPVGRELYDALVAEREANRRQSVTPCPECHGSGALHDPDYTPCSACGTWGVVIPSD